MSFRALPKIELIVISYWPAFKLTKSRPKALRMAKNNREDFLANYSDKEKKVLNEIFKVEKKKLHIRSLSPNSRHEREIITNLSKIIKQAASDAD